MSRRSLTLALVAAFLVPTLLLAWIGLGSLRQESKRVAERYRAQAEAIAHSVEAELGAVLDDLRAGQARGALEPLALRYASDGTWLGESMLPLRAAADEDPALSAALEGEIDRLQAQGDLEHALSRLQEIAAKSKDANLIAWALDTRAAFLDRLDRKDDAQAVRRDLITRFSTQRNSRGLLRSLAARYVLLESEPDPIAAGINLYSDAAADYCALEETATAEFLRQLRQDLDWKISDSDGEHSQLLAQADAFDAARARLRVWTSSARHGATDWIARGAPGASAIFQAIVPQIPATNPRSMEARFDPRRPGDGEFLVAIARAGTEWVGGALELDWAFERALNVAQQDPAVRSLGFATSIGRRDDGAAENVAQLELKAPFQSYVVAVRGGDMATFAASERLRFQLMAGLVALAIAIAAIGAWLTLRGVAREVEAARGREAFVAAVTHELKTPLAAIRLFAEMLERGDVEPVKVREFGARTVLESDRLARLVDSVLDLARIEHGGPAATFVGVDSICNAAVAIVKDYARERGFEIKFTPSEEEIRVRGDSDALTRALVNLLDNAIKYSERPHEIKIEVARRADPFVALSVLDRGRGVPEAERERIFEAFRRVGSELTRDRPGAGLGLALVAKIAAAHGGRATCEAREGGGSRFCLILPIVIEQPS